MDASIPVPRSGAPNGGETRRWHARRQRGGMQGRRWDLDPTCGCWDRPRWSQSRYMGFHAPVRRCSASAKLVRTVCSRRASLARMKQSSLESARDFVLATQRLVED